MQHNITASLLTSLTKTIFEEFIQWFYLEGNWRVFRFHPFDVSALDKRNISNTLEPKATTETSGFPNTNSPSTLRMLKKKKVSNQFIDQYVLKMQWWKDESLSVLPCCNDAGCLNNLPGGLHIATFSHMHHSGPAGSNDPTRSRTSYGGRCINSSLPIRCYKILVVAIFLFSVDHHWRAFRCIAIL